MENAFRIFTVLNNRGIDLAPEDILKAEVVGVISQKDRTKYAVRWEEIDIFLGFQDNDKSKNLNALLEHLATAIQPAIATESNESKQLKLAQLIKAHYRDGLKCWGIDFIDHVLSPHASAFRIVKGASLNLLAGSPDGNTNECNKHLKHLSRLANTEDWVPLAMKLVLRWGIRGSNAETQPDHNRLANLLCLLERRVFCGVVLGTQSRTRQRVYEKITSLIDSGAVDNIAAMLILSEQEKQRVLSRLEMPDFYNKKTYRKYVLLRLDETFAHTQGIYENLPDVISIEHVLPQHPEEEWLKLFPNEEDRSKLTHCLGNLALLPQPINNEASNWPFQKKRDTYFFQKDKLRNPFAITNDLMQYQEWTPALIRQRQEMLLKRCKQIWDLGAVP